MILSLIIGTSTLNQLFSMFYIYAIRQENGRHNIYPIFLLKAAPQYTVESLALSKKIGYRICYKIEVYYSSKVGSD